MRYKYKVTAFTVCILSQQNLTFLKISELPTFISKMISPIKDIHEALCQSYQ